MTLVSAIIEAIERSMPPAMTTIVWAAAAKAKGSAARASEPKSPRAVVGLDQPGDDEEQREEHEQAGDPAFAAERSRIMAPPATRPAVAAPARGRP